MPTKTKEIKPPTGLNRLFFRFPIFLFKIGLGGLMGKRALLLTHLGRTSGLPRQAVLEVVHYDEESKSYIVNAGFGPKSSWYQNLMAKPEASIQVGGKKQNVLAEELLRPDGGDILLNFIKAHPGEASLFKMMGYEVDGTDEDWRALGEELIFIRFSPK